MEKSLLGINSSRLGLLGSHAVNPFQPGAAGLLEACYLCRSQPNSEVWCRDGGEGTAGLNCRTRCFCPETPPAPRAGDGEGREEDNSREKLGPGRELWLHGPATILQILLEWVPLFLVFLAIHALCSVFPPGLSDPHVYFAAEERPQLLV